MPKKKCSLVVLISGNGSNLQAFIDAITANELNANINAVISNQPDAYGLIRAQRAGIHTHTLNHRDFPSRDNYDQHLSALCNQYQPDFIILAGFMRILTANFIKQFTNKIINIHPSLLPAYPGLNTHQRAISNGDKQHGATVHFVTEALDAGPGIIQGIIAVKPNETVESIKERIHKIEHIIYPKALQQLIARQITHRNNNVYFSGEPLSISGHQINFDTI